MATAWLRDFLRSVWTGGRALIPTFSLLVVPPIIACYLIYNWKKMVAVIDDWIPPARRDTVRALAGGHLQSSGMMAIFRSLCI